MNIPRLSPALSSQHHEVCLACLADGRGEAVYPYDDGKCYTDGPVPKLFCIEAEPTVRRTPYKLLILCHSCWHKLEGDDGPDMWTHQKCYEALQPQTPFDDLPRLQYDTPDFQYKQGALPIWRAEHYFQKD
jgi:hypothetical protein